MLSIHSYGCDMVLRHGTASVNALKVSTTMGYVCQNVHSSPFGRLNAVTFVLVILKHVHVQGPRVSRCSRAGNNFAEERVWICKQRAKLFAAQRSE